MKASGTILAVAAFVFSSSMAVAETIAPDTLVKNTANEVLELIRQDSDIQNGDMRKIFDLVEEKVMPHFDLERMSRIALGKDWGHATKEQQDAFLSEFHKLITRTFSSALSMYHNQPIRYKPLPMQPEDRETTVNTQILESNNDTDSLDFSMEKSGDEWKVYDVTIEGVSFLANYRAQFVSVMRQGGIDGLIQKLAAKNMQPLPSHVATDRHRG